MQHSQYNTIQSKQQLIDYKNMSAYKLIKRICRKEKNKERKNTMMAYNRIEKLKRKTKSLTNYNKELTEIILEQNDHYELLHNDHFCAKKIIKDLKIEMKYKDDALKRMVKTNKDTGMETKLVVGIIMSWFMILLMFQYNFVDQESFIIVNVCAILSTILINMF